MRNTLEIGPYGGEERFDANKYDSIRYVIEREVGQRVWEITLTQNGDLEIRVVDRGGHGSEGLLISAHSTNTMVASAAKLSELPRSR